MFGANKSKQIARDGASEWADEALEMFGFNAEAEIRQQMDIHPYPARYAFEYCLAEIEKRRRAQGMAPPSLADRLTGLARKFIPGPGAGKPNEPEMKPRAPVNTCKLFAEAADC